MAQLHLLHGFTHKVDYFKQNLIGVMAFSPCFVNDMDMPDYLEREFRKAIRDGFDHGIVSSSGPTYGEDRDWYYENYP